MYLLLLMKWDGRLSNARARARERCTRCVRRMEWSRRKSGMLLQSPYLTLNRKISSSVCAELYISLGPSRGMLTFLGQWRRTGNVVELDERRNALSSHDLRIGRINTRASASRYGYGRWRRSRPRV